MVCLVCWFPLLSSQFRPETNSKLACEDGWSQLAGKGGQNWWDLSVTKRFFCPGRWMVEDDPASFYGAISAYFSGSNLLLILGRVDLMFGKSTVRKPGKIKRSSNILQSSSLRNSSSQLWWCRISILESWAIGGQEAMIETCEPHLLNVFQGWKGLRNFRNFMISVENSGRVATFVDFLGGKFPKKLRVTASSTICPFFPWRNRLGFWDWKVRGVSGLLLKIITGGKEDTLWFLCICTDVLFLGFKDFLCLSPKIREMIQYDSGVVQPLASLAVFFPIYLKRITGNLEDIIIIIRFLLVGRVFFPLTKQGGDFKCFLFSPLSGEDSHFDSYFSGGLKPPTRKEVAPFQLGKNCPSSGTMSRHKLSASAS